MKKCLLRLAASITFTAVLASALFFSGCSEELFSLYFGIDSMPVNIDPQLASSYSELLTVRNCFCGLTKLNPDGEAVPDTAENIQISDDGRTYRFRLSENAWSDGTPVTADDFVFALERACDPVTAAPSSGKLLNIVGAAERLNGKDASLGVTAENSRTLVITLVNPDKNFLLTLSSAVFMPCNRAFFEKCAGKYGLGRQYILTNGNYSVSQWSDGRHLRLKLKDTTESGNHAEYVYLAVSATGKNNIDRIKNGEIGMTVDDQNDYAAVNASVYTVKTEYQKTYALIFNKNTEVGANKQLTEAFARSVHRELYSARMSSRFRTAHSILPDGSTLFGLKLSSRSEIPDYSYSFDSANARAGFLSAVSDLKSKKLPAMNILTVDNGEITSILGDIISEWQSILGAYVNIKTVASETALMDQIHAGNYTVALIPFSGDAAQILSGIVSDSGMNPNLSELDAAVSGLAGADDAETAIQFMENAAELLSYEPSIIPIVSVPTAYIWDSAYQNVFFSPIDRTVDFSLITK